MIRNPTFVCYTTGQIRNPTFVLYNWSNNDQKPHICAIQLVKSETPHLGKLKHRDCESAKNHEKVHDAIHKF